MIRLDTLEYKQINILGEMKKLPVDCRTNGCGKGASCVLEDGGYICQCPPGMTGSPQKECTLGKCLYFFQLSSIGISTIVFLWIT